MLLLFLLFGLLKSILKTYDIPYLVNLLLFLLPVAVYFVLKILHKRFNDFNISSHLLGKNKFLFPFLLGVSIGVILFCLIISINIAIGTIEDVKFFTVSKKTAEFFFSQIIIGACEEFFFRGFLFLSLLIQSKKVVLSALISSLLFSLMHFQTYPLINQWYIHVGLISSGMVFCYLYLIFRSLWLVIAFHFTNNFLASVISWKQIVLGNEPTDKIQSILMLILCITLTIFILKRKDFKKDFLDPFF